MTTDTELKLRGCEALSEALGDVDAERFIALILKEPFDYTTWQKHLFEDQSIDDISKKAMMTRQQLKKDVNK